MFACLSFGPPNVGITCVHSGQGVSWELNVVPRRVFGMFDMLGFCLIPCLECPLGRRVYVRWVSSTFRAGVFWVDVCGLALMVMGSAFSVGSLYSCLLSMVLCVGVLWFLYGVLVG